MAVKEIGRDFAAFEELSLLQIETPKQKITEQSHKSHARGT